MNTTIRSFNVSGRVLVAGLLAVTALIAIPALASAAMFAYVDQAGDVRTMIADNAMVALATAPSIDEHSGVIQLITQTDGVVGDHVPGV